MSSEQNKWNHSLPHTHIIHNFFNINQRTTKHTNTITTGIRAQTFFVIDHEKPTTTTKIHAKYIRTFGVKWTLEWWKWANLSDAQGTMTSKLVLNKCNGQQWSQSSERKKIAETGPQKSETSIYQVTLNRDIVTIMWDQCGLIVWIKNICHSLLVCLESVQNKITINNNNTRIPINGNLWQVFRENPNNNDNETLKIRILSDAPNVAKNESNLNEMDQTWWEKNEKSPVIGATLAGKELRRPEKS